MRNLNRKDAILLWRKSRKHWILALMCLAVTLSAAVMPREAYAEAETEAAETESEESIREEANIGNVTNGVSVVATSEPGSNEQTGKKVSIKTGAVKNKNAEFMESKGFATFAILAAGGDTGDPSGKNLGPYQTDAKLYDEHGDEIPTGGTVIVGQHL